MNQLVDHPHPLTPNKLNLIPPNSSSNNNNQHVPVLQDYPPKSPDELPNQSATRLLLSSTHSHPHHDHQKLELKAFPLHLPSRPRSPPLSQSLKLNNKQPQTYLLDHFSEECRKMFYTGDPIATKNVETIIKNLPAASKAAYTKQMATVRSQFHRDAASSRRAEVDKLLLDTLPSSIIIKAVGNDSSLSALRSPRARQERLDRLKKFINAHCVRNMVGVHPFFNSLCAVLHLMSLPARKSGSGKRRVEWEIDLAVFCEAGGEPFLVDSIQFLKGVLGFEDHLKPLVASSLRVSFATSTNTYDADESEDEDGAMDVVIGHLDGDDGLTLEERQELEVDESELVQLQGEGPFADSPSEEAYGQARALKGKMTFKGRDRALSDPFLDPAPPPRPAIREHSSPRITVSPPATEEQPHPSTPIRAQSTAQTSSPPTELHPRIASGEHQSQLRRSPTQNSLDAPPPTETRIFRSPSYLTVPELRELIGLFPSFITVRTKPLKFDRNGMLDSSLPSNRAEKSEPAAKLRLRPARPSSSSVSSGTTFAGHGAIRVSVFEKDPGWKGSLIERIKVFFFRLFNL
ncbi:hypothetical protein VP01_671g5 [Puccinia sorghi]|uniref:Uncharacterized protein n=1 Tax=Puccinia sorghi TaxID=27349 RepID=A0A0L6UGY0_9BASI|nr:hypothetical protein VP01_671g5 [Puccinia sorghi]